MSRKVADCTKMPNDVGCSLVIIGEEDEVLRAAMDHAARVHSEPETDEVRAWIAGDLEDEGAWLASHAPSPA
ncbi:DUF1059 domain-containing protein [Yinghuangia soli]|uniref:DUF1059 domain-containing protein n=1 Tax=Yinghuangia soli TaxID=2908204 RepID=A0AA41Q3F3_9ACTN|nr:DUF1059 domain-containing protein [Yinghuangia soli]MCF2530824.1 DUF1059 domain-containing protein [Yinghuangia soli]